MKVSAPFQVTANDVTYSNLRRKDIGKWAIIVTGCWHLFASEAQAQACYENLIRN